MSWTTRSVGFRRLHKSRLDFATNKLECATSFILVIVQGHPWDLIFWHFVLGSCPYNIINSVKISTGYLLQLPRFPCVKSVGLKLFMGTKIWFFVNLIINDNIINFCIFYKDTSLKCWPILKSATATPCVCIPC